jgi:hypothetical protein
MLDQPLESILNSITDRALLPPAYYRQLDCDRVLDARDKNKEFEGGWISLSEKIKALWPSADVSATDQQRAEDIRRESFLAVSRATEQHEIASYVSDDFDLIIRGKLLGLREPFLDQLWDAYQRGEFPVPGT